MSSLRKEPYLGFTVDQQPDSFTRSTESALTPVPWMAGTVIAAKSRHGGEPPVGEY